MTIEDRLALLETQQSLHTVALRRTLEAHWLGAAGAAGTVVPPSGGEPPNIEPRGFPAVGRTRLMLDRAFAPPRAAAQQPKAAQGGAGWGVAGGGRALERNRGGPAVRHPRP